MNQRPERSEAEKQVEREREKHNQLSSEQRLERKIEQAMWYSIQAFSLLHIPSKEQEPFLEPHKKHIIQDLMVRKLEQLKCYPMAPAKFDQAYMKKQDMPCSMVLTIPMDSTTSNDGGVGGGALKNSFLCSPMWSDGNVNSSGSDGGMKSGDGGSSGSAKSDDTYSVFTGCNTFTRFDDDHNLNLKSHHNGHSQAYQLNEGGGGCMNAVLNTHLFCKFSKHELTDTARLMYQSAREILFDSEVFPHWGTNVKLAEASSHLATYLLVSGERIDEAKIFLNATKIYLERAREIMLLDSTRLTGHAREQLQIQQLAIGSLYSKYATVKSLMFVNYAPRTAEFYRKKSLKKLLKMTLSAWKLIEKASRGVLWAQSNGKQVKKLKDIVKRNMEDGTHDREQLKDFLDTCREMRERIQPVTGFARVWKLLTFNLDVFFLEIVASQAGTCTDPSFFECLWDLQLEVANTMAREMYSNIGVAITAGARLSMIIKFVCRIHIEYSVKLCTTEKSPPPSESRKLLDCLAYLHTGSLILEGIDANLSVPSLKELAQQVKSQEEYHKQYLEKMNMSFENPSHGSPSPSPSPHSTPSSPPEASTPEQQPDELFDASIGEIPPPLSPGDDEFFSYLLN